MHACMQVGMHECMQYYAMQCNVMYLQVSDRTPNLSIIDEIDTTSSGLYKVVLSWASTTPVKKYHLRY